jgi:hypothetical protein
VGSPHPTLVYGYINMVNTQLINTLNQIESLIQQYKLDKLAPAKVCLDLTSEQIEEKLSCLPYKVSLEVIDLYQWCHSGRKPFFHLLDIYLLDVDEAISTAITWNESGYLNMIAFPLFSDEDGGVYWTVGSDSQQQISPVWSNDEAEFPPTADAISLKALIEEKFKQLELKKIDE